jgi:hypothetical protein
MAVAEWRKPSAPQPKRTRALRLACALLIGLVAALPLTAQSGSAETDAINEPPVVLPKMTVSIEGLQPSWLLPKADLTEPDFQGVRPQILFPARARMRGVFDGYASVAVLLDAEGRVLDQLVVRYTQPYFGDALIGGIRGQTFTPRRVKGVAVPGRFLVGQRFQLGGAVLVTGMDGVSALMNPERRSVDGPRVLVEPRLEHELDEAPLEFTASAVPTFPPGFQIAPGEEIRVVVSFFVDENGHARIPNVESASPPALVPNVIKAVAQWRFVPPTFKGKPALVFTLRSVLLEPAPAGPPLGR